MHHPRAHHLDPLVAKLLRHITAYQAHVDLDSRLDKRKEARTEAHLHAGASKQLSKKLFKCAFKMCECDILPHDQPLHLKELCLVRHVGRLVAKHLTHGHHAIRRQLVVFDRGAHVPDLRVGGVRAQHLALFIFDKECVLHVARGVILRHVERVEVVPLVFNQRRLCKREAHLKKYLVGLSYEARNGVDTAAFRIYHAYA